MLRPEDIDAIVIHCTASREGVNMTAKDVDRVYKERGFTHIGYHYVIRLDGTVEKGRLDTEIGAHAKTPGLSGRSYNYHSLGIVYVGGLDKNGKPKDTRTPEQKEALRKLVFELMDKYPNICEVIGHRDTSPDLDSDGEIEPHEWIKACPCFEVKAEFPMSICRAKKK